MNSLTLPFTPFIISVFDYLINRKENVLVKIKEVQLLSCNKPQTRKTNISKRSCTKKFMHESIELFVPTSVSGASHRNESCRSNFHSICVLICQNSMQTFQILILCASGSFQIQLTAARWRQVVEIENR